jgi:hypothetical protein
VVTADLHKVRMIYVSLCNFTPYDKPVMTLPHAKPLITVANKYQAARNVPFGIMALVSGFCQNIQMSKACIKVLNPEWN